MFLLPIKQQELRNYRCSEQQQSMQEALELNWKWEKKPLICEQQQFLAFKKVHIFKILIWSEINKHIFWVYFYKIENPS